MNEEPPCGRSPLGRLIKDPDIPAVISSLTARSDPTNSLKGRRFGSPSAQSEVEANRLNPDQQDLAGLPFGKPDQGTSGARARACPLRATVNVANKGQAPGRIGLTVAIR